MLFLGFCLFNIHALKSLCATCWLGRALSVILQTMKMRLILLFSCICIASALSAQSDSVRTVVAKQGDGIYKILRENGYEAKDYYHKFLEINKDKIQLEDQLILGETYILPEKHDTIKPEHIVVIDTVPALCVKPDSTVSDSVPICIPAPSLEKMPQTKMDLRIADTIKGTALKGAIFYLIAGHGGPDPGATSDVDGVMISESRIVSSAVRFFVDNRILRVDANLEGRKTVNLFDANGTLLLSNTFADKYCEISMDALRGKSFVIVTLESGGQLIKTKKIRVK